MNTPIPLRTIGAMSLADFLQNLRVLSGIDFSIVGEVNAIRRCHCRRFQEEAD